MSIYHDLEVEHVITVIDLYKTFHDLNREDALSQISDLKISAEGLSRRKNFEIGFRDDLAAAIAELPPHQRNSIAAFVEGVTDTKKPNFDDDFARWIDTTDLDSQGFADKCANALGDYLILRMPSAKTLVTAHMKITFDPETDVMPHFLTSSYFGGKLARQVQGQIFANGNYAYAVGKVDKNPILRLAKMRPATLPTGQTDLYGVRLGQSKAINRPYGHLIYCLQLIDNKPADILAELQSEAGLTQKKLADRLPDLARIMSLLKPQKAAELGLTANADFG